MFSATGALSLTGAGSISIANSMFSATGALSLTGAGSISIANSMFSATGALSLPADSTITLSNNLFNFSGVLSASATNRLDMKYNTVNKTQFLLDGNLSATCNIQNNYFANPPAQNNITQDGSQKNIILVTRFITPDSVSNNVRYSSWNGFTSSLGQSMFSDSSNTVVSPSKDSTVAWDWQIPGDNSHGAWNGPNPLPVFNLFPPDSTVTFALPTGNAVFTVAASVFPRVLTASLGAAAYATALSDSVRPWFEKDTTLVLNGSARVNSISLPARNEGKPLLFAQVGSTFVAQSVGVEGGSVFVNGSSATGFIPAFAGQNTFRGSNVQVTGLGTDTTVRFDSVTRAGRTVFHSPNTQLPTGYVPLLLSGQPIAYDIATDVEGQDSVRCIFYVGVDTAALAKDSIVAYWNASKMLPVKAALNNLSVVLPFSQNANIVFAVPSGSQAVLPRRMAAIKLREFPPYSIVGPKGAYRADGKMLPSVQR